MKVWILMLVISLLLPLILIVFGFAYAKDAPKKINSYIGYRTPRSMKTRETWEFAHHYLGRLYKIAGFLLLPLVAIVNLIYFGRDFSDGLNIGEFVFYLFALGGYFIPIFLTERALKKNFDENGQPVHESAVKN